MKLSAPLRIALALGIALAVSACAKEPLPVTRPCGVITDSLMTVKGKTPEDDRRVDKHFERGVAAGCWGRF